MKYLNPVTWLQSPFAALIVLALVLRAQVPHALDVYYKLAHVDNESVHSDARYYAIGLELAVLMFVVRRREFASYLFAVMSTLINVAYYTVHGAQMWTLAHIADNWPRWLVSISLPAAIAFYSHVVVEPDHTQPSIDWSWLRSFTVYLSYVRLPVLRNAIAVIDTQSEVIVEHPQLIAQGEVIASIDHDESTQAILAAIQAGNTTPYAISKYTGIAQTTLKRRKGDTYIGRLPQLVAAGVLSNGGSDYRIK